MTIGNTDIITVVDRDNPVTCGECGRRVEIDTTPVDKDRAGPIYEGVCAEHGSFRWQVGRR